MSRADYASSRSPGVVGSGGVLSTVEPESPSARAGLEPGDVVLAAAGVVLADVLDFRWQTDGDTTVLRVRDRSGSERDVSLSRKPGEAWGLDFEEALFDRVRTCRNDCAFCFMAQLPKGLRQPLYLRDDDFRLSFLQGNFVTLTNLTDADVERIGEQRLSPLYVSLHAVSPEVRERLICARQDRALERFDQLVEAGIELHVQVVLVPGVNDGDELESTLTWLAEREGVKSVGIVPLGFTRHQTDFTASFNDPVAAATVIQQVQRWQFAMRERDNITWVYLADEFYLNARAPFPTADWYDGYPQYENGIGTVRTFGDGAAEVRAQLDAAVSALPADAECVTVVTGVMAATTLAGALNACDASGRVRLLVVPNTFFGGNVSVTGLLTAEDIVPALIHDLARIDAPTAYLLPDILFNADGLTLDGSRASDIIARTSAEVRVVSCDVRGLLDGLRGVAENPPSHLKE